MALMLARGINCVIYVKGKLCKQLIWFECMRPTIVQS
jgi:hypothetical protein